MSVALGPSFLISCFMDELLSENARGGANAVPGVAWSLLGTAHGQIQGCQRAAGPNGGPRLREEVLPGIPEARPRGGRGRTQGTGEAGLRRAQGARAH